VKSSISPDAERFRKWQVDALKAHPPGTKLRRCGPFQVVLPDSPDDEPWVTLTEPRVSRTELERAVGRLREILGERKPGWQIEYNEAVLPDVEPWLTAAGFALIERNPLMGCRPDGFRPHSAEGVTLDRLGPDSAESDLQAFQRIRWTNGGEHERLIPTTDQLRRELTKAGSVYLLAWLDGEPAGTGVSHPLEGAAEIVGVATSVKRRRRGVAATVTSQLVHWHFNSDGDFVFLDASGAEAARVYERLGFVRFGANLIFG
jgi:ribosomal protein S18 acetylase RimI-like enzyme